MFLRRQAEATGWRPETGASGRQPPRLCRARTAGTGSTTANPQVRPESGGSSSDYDCAPPPQQPCRPANVPA